MIDPRKITVKSTLPQCDPVSYDLIAREVLFHDSDSPQRVDLICAMVVIAAALALIAAYTWGVI